jgi:predicted CopG family antitoxin
LLNTLDYDEDIKGVDKFLSRLVGSITKDIEQYSSKGFNDSWRKASMYQREKIGKRVRSDIARSLSTGQSPDLVMQYMNTKQDIDLVKDITGKTKKGRKIFDTVKKTKLNEIFSNAFDNNGSMVTGNFSKIFKESKHGQQEILHTLLGDDQYTKLKDISKIAQSFSDSGKQLLNTSGTAITGSELGILGGLTGISGSPLPAASYAASVNLATKVLSEPKFVNQMHAYALARKTGKEKDAEVILKRISNIMNNLKPKNMINPPINAIKNWELNDESYQEKLYN